MFNKKLFFIVGRGRSGTTLLSKILDSNNLISIPGELLFSINLLSKYSQVTKITKKNIEEIVEDIFLEKRMFLQNFNKENLKHDLQRVVGTISYSELCRYIYFSLAKQRGKNNAVMVGDKNPHYALFLPELIQLFPDAKFIYLVRDYRDNIVSYKNMHFDMNSTAALAYRWLFFNKKVLEQIKKNTNKFYTIRYEDLIIDTTNKLKELCLFLDIDYDKKILDFYKHSPIENSLSWHKNLNNPLNADNIHKWKKQMNPVDIQKADYICGELGKELRYIVENEKNNFLLFWSTRKGVIYAWFYTSIERFLFFLPFKLRTCIVNLIRSQQFKRHQ